MVIVVSDDARTDVDNRPQVDDVTLSNSSAQQGQGGAAPRQMKLRYAGKCRLCGTDLARRSEAIYEPATKTVRCIECPSPDSNAAATTSAAATVTPETSVTPETTTPPPTADLESTAELESGTAGGSARREHERRRARDDDRTRQAWGPAGRIAVALKRQRQPTKAWETGAEGEERVGAHLDSLARQPQSEDASIAVLHDRRIPGKTSNIDHIVITSGGVWVIDAKRYQRQRPELKRRATPSLPHGEKLMVGSHDKTKMVDEALKQVALVAAVVGDLPVTGALCFVDADWPLLRGTFVTRGIHVLAPKRLTKLLAHDTGAVDVRAVRNALAAHFPPA